MQTTKNKYVLSVTVSCTWCPGNMATSTRHTAQTRCWQRFTKKMRFADECVEMGPSKHADRHPGFKMSMKDAKTSKKLKKVISIRLILSFLVTSFIRRSKLDVFFIWGPHTNASTRELTCKRTHAHAERWASK